MAPIHSRCCGAQQGSPLTLLPLAAVAAVVCLWETTPSIYYCQTKIYGFDSFLFLRSLAFGERFPKEMSFVNRSFDRTWFFGPSYQNLSRPPSTDCKSFNTVVLISWFVTKVAHGAKGVRQEVKSHTHPFHRDFSLMMILVRGRGESVGWVRMRHVGVCVGVYLLDLDRNQQEWFVCCERQDCSSSLSSLPKMRGWNNLVFHNKQDKSDLLNCYCVLERTCYGKETRIATIRPSSKIKCCQTAMYGRKFQQHFQVFLELCIADNVRCDAWNDGIERWLWRWLGRGRYSQRQQLGNANISSGWVVWEVVGIVGMRWDDELHSHGGVRGSSFLHEGMGSLQV
jgi:hypothetical protein